MSFNPLLTRCFANTTGSNVCNHLLGAINAESWDCCTFAPTSRSSLVVFDDISAYTNLEVCDSRIRHMKREPYFSTRQNRIFFFPGRLWLANQIGKSRPFDFLQLPLGDFRRFSESIQESDKIWASPICNTIELDIKWLQRVSLSILSQIERKCW